MCERGVSDHAVEGGAGDECMRAPRLRRCRTLARSTDRQLVGWGDVDSQPKCLNGLEGQPQLRAWLSFLERGYPKPAGTDALGQLGLCEAGRLTAFAYECADNCGVDGLGHGGSGRALTPEYVDVRYHSARVGVRQHAIGVDGRQHSGVSQALPGCHGRSTVELRPRHGIVVLTVRGAKRGHHREGSGALTSPTLTSPWCGSRSMVRWGIRASSAPSVTRLVEMGAIERIGRGRQSRLLLSRRFYSRTGKRGEYTRRRGLDRETNKALLLQRLTSTGAEGCGG